MRSGTIAFLLGVCAVLYSPSLPTASAIMGVGCVFIPCAAYYSRHRLVRSALWGLAGVLWALLSLPQPIHAPHTEQVLEGEICRLVETQGTTRRVWLCDQQQRLWLLQWSGAEALHIGQHWRLQVRLQAAHASANPGGFNRAQWQYAQGAVASAKVLPTPAPQRLATSSAYPLQQWRATQLDLWQQQLPRSPYRPLLNALGLGWQADITAEQWQVLQRTGTTHLIAVSGSHLAIVAGWLYTLSALVWAALPWRWAQRWPRPLFAVLPTLIGCTLYTGITGAALPTQRAWLMLLLAALAILSRRSLSSSHLLAWALLGVLLWQPQAPLSPGFWLSFIAVGIIFYRLSASDALHWRAQLAVQLWLWLGLLPLTQVWFQQMSMIAPLANLLAIPWLGLGTLPLLLFACITAPWPALQSLMLQLADASMALFWPLLEWLAAPEWALIALTPPPWWAVVFAVVGLLYLSFPVALPQRWLALSSLLPLLWPPLEQPQPGEFWLDTLAVGAGLAVVVRTAEHTLLYDSGPGRADWNAGERIILPFLRSTGRTRLDGLMLSHADTQHSGGARALLAALEVQQRWVNDLNSLPLTGAQLCRAGQHWQWDGVEFRVLYPQLNRAGDGYSCVLRITSRYGRALLTGDSEGPAIRQLLQHPQSLPAEVLLAPHHGQRPAPTPAFLQAVAARYVLFSTQAHNRYGYPRPATRTAFQQYGAQLLNTAELGAIQLRFTASQLQLSSQRFPRYQPFWQYD